jgi:hypothetical protein
MSSRRAAAAGHTPDFVDRDLEQFVIGGIGDRPARARADPAVNPAASETLQEEGWAQMRGRADVI